MSAPVEVAMALRPAWPMYRALVGIGLGCGLLIVTVFELTRPIIAANRAEALQKAVFVVVPTATTSRTWSFDERVGFAAHVGAGADLRDLPVVYAGYDEVGELAGVAIEAAGMGYQDTITILYGYSVRDDAVIGMQVLESRETPGLGDKIEKDPDFRENFAKLEVKLDAQGLVENPIIPVKKGSKTKPWQIDAITGATISSHAVASILRQSTAVWVPRIEARANELAGPAGRPGPMGRPGPAGRAGRPGPVAIDEVKQ